MAGLVFTATLVSVLVTDVLSAWIVQALVHTAPEPAAATAPAAEGRP
jgi:hypothetical protein